MASTESTKKSLRLKDQGFSRLQPSLDKINQLERTAESLSYAELSGMAERFRQLLTEGASLDDLLEDAFAIVREGIKRLRGVRLGDEQLLGGMLLHNGAIVQIQARSGKTLMAALPAYLNALVGNGVHIVTSNDYLAIRDAERMGDLFDFLGLTTGVVFGEHTDGARMSDDERRAAYACDITYGTHLEFGFDYLRDNMKYSQDQLAQRGHAFAIVNEVDCVLIDDAGDPLIVSGPTDDRSELYRTIDRIVSNLGPDDIDRHSQTRSVTFTASGLDKVERQLSAQGLITGSLLAVSNVLMLHHSNQALRAHHVFSRGQDYGVEDNRVILIDLFTGRMMQTRRLSLGLHQAIEAKENVEIMPENQTLASISLQNYFRLYDKLAGIGARVIGEASEFADIYSLATFELPTEDQTQRVDENDLVFRSATAKYNQITQDVREAHEQGQPVILGTLSREKSETVSAFLSQANIPCILLNGRHPAMDREMLRHAGLPGAVTIVSQDLWRGIDVPLGGTQEYFAGIASQEHRDIHRSEPTEGQREAIAEQATLDTIDAQERVRALGGLLVLGTERHEVSRQDDLLRDLAGAQGDVGRTKFYSALDDDLMRVFAAERLNSILKGLGIEEDEGISHPWLNKAIETAQKKREQVRFDARMNALRYDDVIDEQRRLIYEQRNEIMRADNVLEEIDDMRAAVISDLVSLYLSNLSEGSIETLGVSCFTVLDVKPPISEWALEEHISRDDLEARIYSAATEAYQKKVELAGRDQFRAVEKQILLQTLDGLWRDHLLKLEQLRSVIHFGLYGNSDPLSEYKTSVFKLFYHMIAAIRLQTTTWLSKAQIQSNPDLRRFTDPNVLGLLNSNARALETPKSDTRQLMSFIPSMSPLGGVITATIFSRAPVSQIADREIDLRLSHSFEGCNFYFANVAGSNAIFEAFLPQASEAGAARFTFRWSFRADLLEVSSRLITRLHSDWVKGSTRVDIFGPDEVATYEADSGETSQQIVRDILASEIEGVFPSAARLYDQNRTSSAIELMISQSSADDPMIVYASGPEAFLRDCARLHANLAMHDVITGLGSISSNLSTQQTTGVTG